MTADDDPLLPTPVAADGIAGSPERPSRVNRPVDLPTVAYRLAQQQEDPLFPTPKAHDGVFGRPRTSGRPIEKSTHLGTIVTLLPPGDAPVKLLPTPTTSDSRGASSGGAHDENVRVPRLAAAVEVDLPRELAEEDARAGEALLPTPQAGDSTGGQTSHPDQRRANRHSLNLPQVVRHELAHPLLPTPTQSDGSGGGIRTGLSWDGTTKSTGAGGNSRLRDVVGLFIGEDDNQEDAMRKKSETRPGTDHGPTVEQAMDLVQGELPLEFDSWDEVPDGWRPLVKDGADDDRPETVDPGADWVVSPDDAVFPTPSAADGHRGGTDPDRTRAAGHRVKLIDAVLGDDIQPDDPLLPTPNVGASRASNSPGEMSRNTPALGAVVADLENPVPLLPTPRAQEPTRTNEGYGNGLRETVERLIPAEGGQDSLLPTPTARDHKGRTHPDERTDRTTRGDYLPDALHKIDDPRPIGDAPADLLPTPKTHQRGDCPSERERNSPDLAAVTGHFPAGRWGKYGPAVARWEALTRPAPAPTEPNKNGNPRLTARFSEWLIGWPEGWVTDPDIGVSRTAQLRIVGNGVVPQQAYAAISMLLESLDAPAPED